MCLLDAHALSGKTVRAFVVLINLMETRTSRACQIMLSSLSLTTCSIGTFAQTTTTLREVVVTASRVETPITDVTADVTYIDRETLDRAGQTSLREVLGQQPGVQWTSSGSYRSSTGIFLRGASSSQSIFLVDGIRIGSATSGTAAIENIPLDRIDHIEILRGAASALYGPDAVGGVIQIFTKNPTQDLQASVMVGAGTDGQLKSAASLSSTTGISSYSLGVTQEKATGISTNNCPASSGFNADADGFNSVSWDAKLIAKLTADQTVTLSTIQSQTNYQFDGTPSPNPLGLTKASSDAWSKPVLNDVALKWDAKWTADWTSAVSLGTADDQSVTEYFRLSDGAFGGSSKFNTRRNQVSWQNNLRFGTDVLTAILEERNESVDSSTAYKVSQRDISGTMLSYAWNRPVWNVLAVVRDDENSQFGSFVDWALSGGYKVAEGLRTVASLGTSYQAPTFNQLYFPGFGSPTLTPQRNRSSELGLKFDAPNLSWSAITYYNEIQGFIDPATNVQSSKAVLQGATLSAQIDAEDMSYAASYDYADPHSFSATPALNGLRLARVAQNVLKGSVNKRINDFHVFAEVNLSGEREDAKVVGSGREILPSYATLNVGADWKVRKDLKLLARLNNATDTSYMLANGYSMPGRNLFVSMVWSN
jgi:vitamin B12 transporter